MLLEDCDDSSGRAHTPVHGNNLGVSEIKESDVNKIIKLLKLEKLLKFEKLLKLGKLTHLTLC